MPEIIPIRDLKKYQCDFAALPRNAGTHLCDKKRLWGYGYHEHKGSSDVVRGVFIYIVSCIFSWHIADYIDYYNNSRIQAKWMQHRIQFLSADFYPCPEKPGTYQKRR